MNFFRFGARPGARLAPSDTGESAVGESGRRHRQLGETMGVRSAHLEWIARARIGRSVARDISRGIPARHGSPVAGDR